MARINLILLAVLTACALGLVTSQDKTRKLFAELEHEQELAKQLDVEWGQLQLEQSTWAMHARVEKKQDFTPHGGNRRCGQECRRSAAPPPSHARRRGRAEEKSREKREERAMRV